MLTSSPSELVSQAQTALSESPFYALRQIQVEQASETGLVLIGKVSTYYQKQQAQEIVRTIVQGLTVDNAIEVS